MSRKQVDFTKIAAITDIHYGRKSNSREHNINCENFIKWFIEEARANNCKTGVFLGDYNHHRGSINVSTLNYGVSGLRMLNEFFDDFYFIVGNHDSYYRDKLEIHSLPYINEFENIHAVDKIITEGDFAFVPWLTGEEWKQIPKITQPWMFGHFELPRFKMNAMVDMPDHGQLNSNHFTHQKMVFSGHFHKRQNQGKIWYIGNAFPHDYSDSWDDDRGMMIWEPEKPPTFKSWPAAPKFRTAQLSNVLTNPTAYIDEFTHAKLTIDININYEEVTFIKELFENELRAREINLITNRSVDGITIDSAAELDFQSVDSIVISHLQSIESTTIDKQRLIDIYNSL